MIRASLSRLLAAAALSALVAGCVEGDGSLPTGGKHWVAISSQTQALMTEKGMSRSDPILLRAYKKESELEVWKKGRDGTYELLKTYPMCRWSGQLGPKVREGDRQVPEGFYAITPGQMNPNSSYYLSFNVGYPNQLDRSFGRTGGNIMVHGACSSAGCFSMTDEQIADLYAVMREAFAGGQKSIQFQSFPFRLNAKNLAKFRLDPNMPFWKNLKEGSDHFDVTKTEPQVGTCSRKYVFDAKPKSGTLEASVACPPLEVDQALSQAVAQKDREDERQVAELVQQGVKPVREIYQDGDQHPSFKAKLLAYTTDTSGRVLPVSRPDALAEGPTEVPIEEGKAVGKAPAKVFALASSSSKPLAQTPVVGQAASAPTAQAFAPVEPVTAPVQAEPAKVASGGFFGRLFNGSEAKPETPTEVVAGGLVDVPLPPRRQAATLVTGRQAALAIPGSFVATAQQLR